MQIQDAQGRPISVGLDDLLASLEKHYAEAPDDLNRGRLYAQELMKYRRHEQAEKVMAKVVASGGSGQDWLGLGVAQVANEKWDKAESTLKGAQNLMPDNPFPSLHLAKVYRSKDDAALERQMAEKAISIDPNCVEAWAYYFARARETDGDEAAEKRGVAAEVLADAGRDMWPAIDRHDPRVVNHLVADDELIRRLQDHVAVAIGHGHDRSDDAAGDAAIVEREVLEGVEGAFAEASAIARCPS